MSPQKITSFEEGWEILKKGIIKLQNIVEGLNEPKFTSVENLMLYLTVFDLCNIPHCYAVEIYGKYKETGEEYIRSKVLPSLQEKNDDHLLRELLTRWSNYQVMTKHLSEFFGYLERPDIPIYCRAPLPLEETSFRSFYHLVYEGMNKEIMDAIFSMMERKLTGEKIDPTFVVNTLDFYFKFYKWTEKDDAKDVLSSKKIKLISSDDVTFEVDHRVALMSKRFEDITETISVGDDVDTISVPKMSSKMLDMAVEYYKKLYKPSEVVYWNALFVDGGDPKTLLDLATIACYMKIVELEKLTWSKLGELIKGKTPEEIAMIFGAAVDD